MIKKAFIFMSFFWLSCLILQAKIIDNGQVYIENILVNENSVGFSISTEKSKIAEIKFNPLNNVIAQEVMTGENDGYKFITFNELKSEIGTPIFSNESYVMVKLYPNEPFPEIQFKLELIDFSKKLWEKEYGTIPFHFLSCCLEGAEIFYQRGWTIPTPVIDEYPLHNQATGYGRQITSEWSEDWTYAPPLGAYPVASVGLWKPSGRKFVAYDFHRARLTDNSEKEIGSAYCWKLKSTGEFFTLVVPYARPYQKLRYPEPGKTLSIESHFHILYSANMASDDDPNLFVNEFIWERYSNLMPEVPKMNNLSWLPSSNRMHSFPKPNVGRLYHRLGKNARWFKPGALVKNGISWDGDPITYLYQTGQHGKIEQLKKDIDFLLKYAKRMEIDGDECYFWEKPLEGEGIDMFGPGVKTIHNIQGWQVALTLLDVYRNDPSQKHLLPYIHGALRYTKHILYTRNGYADVPTAQFAWGAAPVTTFCLRYYYTFRDALDLRHLTDLAYKLARTMLYRYLPIWASDNDKMDNLDSSFMMEPNSGISWLGSACSNEVWVVAYALAQVYVATGDAILGHYLRGMLNHWHELFKDEYYPTVAEYNGALTERFGLFDGAAQSKGTRASYGGLWGEFEKLGFPIKDSNARVLCGEKAAIAFNTNGMHTDIDEYRYYGRLGKFAYLPCRFSFKVVPFSDKFKQNEPFALTVTFPYFVFSQKNVYIARNGKTIKLKSGEMLETFVQRPDSLYIKNVKYGDVIKVGETDSESVDILKSEIANPQQKPKTVDNFHIIDLHKHANRRLNMDWNNPNSWAGLESGIRTIYGAPFELIDRFSNDGKICARDVDITIDLENAKHLFALIGEIREDSKLTISSSDGTKQNIDLEKAVPALKGWPPCFDWHIELIQFPVKKAHTIHIHNLSIFAVTIFSGKSEDLAHTLEIINNEREEFIAKKKAVEGLRKLTPLLEKFSGHIAVLPVPGNTNPRSSPVMKLIQRAGLSKHFVILNPLQFVDTNFFNSERFWVTLYLGGEKYYQDVRGIRRGDKALRQYLSTGGTLLVLPSGPYPFYYNENEEAVVNAGKFGLPICGNGAKREPRDVIINSWEKPPKEHNFTFYMNPNQEIITSLPRKFGFPEDIDLRWRPIVNVLNPEDKYVPVLTLRDETGQSYGDGIAWVEHRTGRLKNARLAYVWSPLVSHQKYQIPIITELFDYVLQNTTTPPFKTSCIYKQGKIEVNGELDEPAWKQAIRLEGFSLLDGEKKQKFSTVGRMLWDENNLYISFECEDDDIWAKWRNFDDPLWENEVVEVFIDAEGDGIDYKEFEVNPVNTLVDLNIHKVDEEGRIGDWRENRKWNATGIKSAVKVDGTIEERNDKDHKWAVEMKIPFQNFQAGTPLIGDIWRIQLYRIDRPQKQDTPSLYFWSPTDAFHKPERFGYVQFIGNPYHDDFSNYPESSDGTPTWQINSGKWQIENGVYTGINSGTDGWIANGARTGFDDWRDYTFKIRFQIVSRASDWRDGPWFGFRHKDIQNCYSLNFSNRDIQLHKVSHGVATSDEDPMANLSWKPDNQWHELKISVIGKKIKVWLDDKMIIDIIDKRFNGVEPLKNGGIVLSARKWSQSRGKTVIKFDNFEIELDDLVD